MSTKSFTLADQVSRELRLHARIVQAQLDGLSEADTLLQPPDGGNCLNWLLGHLLVSRQTMFALLGVAPLDNATDYQRYVRDSQPVTHATDALPLSRLLSDLAASQKRLLARLGEISAEELATIPTGQERNVGEQVSFLSWHETYHVGQMEQLRRLAGKTEKVI